MIQRFPPVSDVVADLEAEGIAIEGERSVRVVLRKEARVNSDVHGVSLSVGDVHGNQSSSGSEGGASRFLIGRVTCFAMHDGIPSVACVCWRR